MKILHLEDNRDDALLVRTLLAANWPGCEIVTATSREEFAAALTREHDLILSDFTLPLFNGHEALALAKAAAPDTPFVFFSGTIGEERAIEAVQLGAADYVLKGNLKRLVTAIRRAVREAAERRSRRLVEEQLRRSEERHRHIFLKSPLPMLVYESDTFVFLDVNDAAIRQYGYSREEFLAMTIMDIRPPEDGARLKKILADEPPGASDTGTWRHRKKDGTIIHVEVVSHALVFDGTAARLVQVNDVTARLEAERQVNELIGFLDRASDAIIVNDLDGRITFWNQGATRIYGWTAGETYGRHMVELFGGSALTEIGEAREQLQACGEWRGEVRTRNKAGDVLQVELSATTIRDHAGRPQARLSIATDITERRKLEDQFLRAQRLESVGMLATGIAHDLNNVLAPILMGAPMLREHVTDPGDLQLLALMEKSTERGAALVRQILGFAHGVEGEPATLQVRHVIHDLSNVIRETFPKNIRYEERVPRELWAIVGHPTQIHQVLLNLCVNARDAMPDGGTLRLRAENVVLDELAAQALDGARAGPWLVLHVEDTGTGIPPETLARIWEPFFTTKDASRGTGLGLSTVRGILANHQGFITVQSEPGRGTVFRVYLPADERAFAAPAAPAPAQIPRGEGELILIVDDEASIRDITTAMLARHGYRVIAARDGTEALALFAPRDREVRIVITDLNMPRLDGAAIAGVVRRLNPGVKILAISGLSSADRSPAKPPAFADAFLAKPFSIEALLVGVHRLLHRTAPVAGA